VFFFFLFHSIVFLISDSLGSPYVGRDNGLIFMAVFKGNSSLEPLLEGLFAQIHIDLSRRGFDQNRTGDLQITQIFRVPRH